MNDKDLIGKTEKEAVDMIETAGLQWRVILRESHYFVTTDDYQLNRINLSIKNNVVVHTKRG